MNTENMKLFCTVYETGSIARAADALFISHQAVSRRLAAVEEECGAKLFARIPKGLEPTKAGQDAYRTFTSILNMYQGFCQRAAKTGAARAHIRLAIEFYDIDIVNLDGLLAFEKAAMDNPTLEVRFLSNMDCYRQLLDGRIDIAITNRPFIDAGKFEFAPLKADRACFAVSERNPLASKERLEPGDFAGQTFLAIIDADGTNQAILQRFSELGVSPLVEAVTYDMNSLASIIRSNRGFHTCPEEYTAPLKERPGIAVRVLPGFDGIFELGLVYAKSHAKNPALASLVDFVRQHTAEVVARG